MFIELRSYGNGFFLDWWVKLHDNSFQTPYSVSVEDFSPFGLTWPWQCKQTPSLRSPISSFLFLQQELRPASCWNDLHETLINAREIICITGWAVWDKLQLFRGDDLAKDRRTLGEILVDKANQGVNVYVMVWAEKVSGVMGTHDTETFNFFKKSKVTCALAPR